MKNLKLKERTFFFYPKKTVKRIRWRTIFAFTGHLYIFPMFISMVGWFYILNIWLDVLCKYNCMELNFCIGSNTTWWTNFWDGGWVCETCQSFLWEEMAYFCFPWFSSPRYSWTSISTSLYSRNKWVQTGSWYLIFSLSFFHPYH